MHFTVSLSLLDTHAAANGQLSLSERSNSPARGGLEAASRHLPCWRIEGNQKER